MLNKFFIFDVFILMNILMNLDFDSEKKGIFVFLVIVLVSNVFLVFGGLIKSIFFGIFVFIVVNFFGIFKNLMIFWKFCFVLLILVMLLNVILVLGFIWNLVLFL